MRRGEASPSFVLPSLSSHITTLLHSAECFSHPFLLIALSVYLSMW